MVKIFASFIQQRWIQDHVVIKRFRTDNGGESVNTVILTLLDKHGIIPDWTPLYPHQSNGIAERYNRTIITAAQSMLTGLPL